jgi:molybdate transport system ATP-binding protein
MKLDAQFQLRRGELELDIALTVQPGETLALVGPNGAGKTTCLLALAGALHIDSGRITLGDYVLDCAEPYVFWPPERRFVGFVFQDQLLFPHLSALDNVAFGLRTHGHSRSVARARAYNRLEEAGLEHLERKRPGELSGGQAQRVALARALATDPNVLLLDEPLSALDASARIELRRDLRAHLDDFTGVSILVAHDALDAFALADRIAVLEDGRIVQSGSAAEICAHPRSSYVADLVGLNLLRANAEKSVLHFPSGGRLVVASPLEGPVLASVHPRAVALFRERPDGSPRNVWQAPVTSIETAVDRLRVRTGGEVPLVAEVTPAAAADLGLAEGAPVWVAVKATEVVVYSD